MSLVNIVRKAKLKPPIMVLYGPGGIGKTSFGATMNKPIIVQAEDGIGKINCPHTEVAKTYLEFQDNLKYFIDEDDEFKTIVVDSLDWLETLIHEHICEKNGWPDISSPAYGKGYASAIETWKEYLVLLNQLRAKGYTILQIAHNEVRRYEDPSSEPHDRHQIKLHRKAADLVIEHSDAVFFANFKIGTIQKKGKGGGMTTHLKQGDRTIFTQQTPGFQAKNRFGLDAEMPFDWSAIREQMLK
jgi:hypothetical protein